MNSGDVVFGKSSETHQVFDTMARIGFQSGLVKSQGGLHGGFSLIRVPDKITILEVVNSVDPINRITECPLGISSHGVNLCPLHSRLDRATALVEDAFRETTLAEVLAEPTSSVPLCQFPSK